MPTNAVTDRMAFRYFVEDSFGVPPSPPTLNDLLITSEDLTTNFETVESEGVTGDRQVPDIVRVGRVAEGTINFELMYGDIDDLLQGALAQAWDTDIIQNDSELISFGFEKAFQDLTQFYLFLGCRVNTFSLNLALQSKITGSVGIMGKGGVFDDATGGDGSPTPYVQNPTMVTLSTLSLREANTAMTCPTSFTFQTTNELREKRCLGEDDLSDLNLGVFRVTGTLESYFEDRRYIDKLIADEPTEFEIITEDSDGNAYSWIFPRLKFTSLAGPSNSGRSSDVMQTLNWTAYKDPSSGITMQVER